MTMLLNIGQTLTAQARLQPERIGARDLERDLTFRDWNTRACRLANALLALGLSKGDRIAVLAYNRVEWAEIYVAVAKAGLVAVPINFRLTAPEAHYIAADCDVAAVITEIALFDVADAMCADLERPAGNCILIGDDDRDGWHRYEDLIAAADDTEPEIEVSPDDTWCLMYTSGTTGNPKGAIRSHRGMAMLALMTEVELSLARGDNALLVMPMCHANSLNFFAAFVYIGAQVTCLLYTSDAADECPAV